jgi:glycosyltransferase involved in cell wall biosynthesis
MKIQSTNVVVSVIIATRNDADRVGLAIISVLQQSFPEFEIIVVNDASTDNTASILEWYKNIDSRIHIITNPGQLGRAGARNVGIRNASGEFIAVLDSDDIMFPDRLDRQVNFMHQNPTIGMLGTWAVFEVGEDFYLAQSPCESIVIRNRLESGQNNALINSSLLGRKSLFLSTGGYLFSAYSPTYNEDYYTFRSLVSKTEFANLSDPLVLVCTDGLINPRIMKCKLREMHAYEWHTLHDNISYSRIKRLILRRLMLLIPDRIFAALYQRRIRLMPSYVQLEVVKALKRQIDEQRTTIENNYRFICKKIVGKIP